jgi:hypothetical protein
MVAMNNVLSALLLLCAQVGTKIPESDLTSNHIKIEKLKAQRDSTNYILKVVKEEIGFTSISFTIVSKDNTPDYALIFLLDENRKSISGIMTDKTGKLSLYIWDDKVKTISISNFGSGQVKIPIEKVKNKLVDIEVQLYPETIVN